VLFPQPLARFDREPRKPAAAPLNYGILSRICNVNKKPAPAKRGQETEGLSLNFAASRLRESWRQGKLNTHFNHYTLVFWKSQEMGRPSRISSFTPRGPASPAFSFEFPASPVGSALASENSNGGLALIRERILSKMREGLCVVDKNTTTARFSR
jgi:hypothetical protein